MSEPVTLHSEDLKSLILQAQRTGMMLAAHALIKYNGEDITSCLHSLEWGQWLLNNSENILNEQNS